MLHPTHRSTIMMSCIQGVSVAFGEGFTELSKNSTVLEISFPEKMALRILKGNCRSFSSGFLFLLRVGHQTKWICCLGDARMIYFAGIFFVQQKVL